jgi:hypothetical protein
MVLALLVLRREHGFLELYQGDMRLLEQNR